MGDSGISLNINTSRKSFQTKEKQHLNKSDRIKQLRQKKREHERDVQLAMAEFESKTSSYEESTKTPAGKTVHAPKTKAVAKTKTGHAPKTKAVASTKKTNTPQLQLSHKKPTKSSSLFRNNPEIPILDNGPAESNRQKSNVFATKTFADLDIHPFLVSNLESKLHFQTLTTVQQKAIPEFLAGHDLLIKSQTGSGKTLAYAVPIMQQLQAYNPRLTRHDGIHSLVIVPTRELAVQSLEVFQKLAQSFVWIVPGALMGGENRNKEKARLRKGVTVLIATPGRLIDHLDNTSSLSFTRVRHLVIDEADRLLDMGFEKSVSRVLKVMKDTVQGHLQTILLSATLSQGVERLAGMTLREPVHVTVSDDDALRHVQPSTGEVFATPATLRHHYVLVPGKLRLVTLLAFILWKCKYSSHDRKMLVFFSTQDSVHFHHRLLQALLVQEDVDLDESLNLFKLYGDMEQKERTHVFKSFSEVKSGVLLCTDVAARGLDLPQVGWIVQYNTPGRPTDYIHRVGRTARAGQSGHALVLLEPGEAEYTKILKDMNIRLSPLDMDTILQTLVTYVQNNLEVFVTEKSFPHTVQECATAVQRKVEEIVQESKDTRTMARKAFQSFVRAYAGYPADLKHIFHVKKLHLGHMAKSFGLQDAPKRIGEIITGTYGREFKREAEGKRIDKKRKQSFADHPPVKRRRFDLMSEFASGMSAEGTETLNLPSRKKMMARKQPLGFKTRPLK